MVVAQVNNCVTTEIEWAALRVHGGGAEARRERGRGGHRDVRTAPSAWVRGRDEERETDAFYAVIAAMEQERERLGDGGPDPRDKGTMYESEAIPETTQKLWKAMGEGQRQELFSESVASYYRQAVCWVGRGRGGRQRATSRGWRGAGGMLVGRRVGAGYRDEGPVL